ncbi:Ff.00g040390.m01.CDS01 [Fusarium sp. VM40]|nr:Ff.00g040390.m01.CDS01 [Fusarium sp. VM40]
MITPRQNDQYSHGLFVHEILEAILSNKPFANLDNPQTSRTKYLGMIDALPNRHLARLPKAQPLNTKSLDKDFWSGSIPNSLSVLTATG